MIDPNSPPPSGSGSTRNGMTTDWVDAGGGSVRGSAGQARGDDVEKGGEEIEALRSSGSARRTLEFPRESDDDDGGGGGGGGSGGASAAAVSGGMDHPPEEVQEVAESMMWAHPNRDRERGEAGEAEAEAEADERSMTNLPSACTSFTRVDDEGHSLLHRGGDSGGVYDSMGTMSGMSGIDYGGNRAGSGGKGMGLLRPSSSMPKPLHSRKVSWGLDGASDRGGGVGAGDDRVGKSPRLPNPKTPAARLVSWGSDASDHGSTLTDDGGEEEKRAAVDAAPMGRSFLDMMQNMAASTRGIFRSERSLVSVRSELGPADSEPSDVGDAVDVEQKPKKKRTAWSAVHRRLESVILKGGEEKSDFDFGQVRLDEVDLARLQAAGVTCSDGRVVDSEIALEQHGSLVGDFIKSIKGKVKKEKLLAKTDRYRRSKFDITLKECIVAICAYLALSVAAFSLAFERWPVVDSLYFAVVTFTTIGYGDLTPSTIPGQIFMCFFGLGGVASLGLALGVIGSNLIDAQVNAIDSAKDVNRREAMTLFEDDDKMPKSSEVTERSGLLQVPADGDSRTSGVKARCYDLCGSIISSPFVKSLAVILLGSMFIAMREGWGWVTGVYYAVVTTCTIGFGDFAPTLQYTRLFSVFFIPVAVGIMGHFLGAVSNYVIEERQREFRRELENTELKMEHLEGMSGSGDGIVTKLDFVEFMLLAMSKVDKEELESLHAQFERLDVTGDGTLTENDLKVMIKKKLRSPKKKLELARYKNSLLQRYPEKEKGADGTSLEQAVEGLLTSL